jgi:hypothetical protein
MTILNFISNGTTPARGNGNLVKVGLAILNFISNGTTPARGNGNLVKVGLAISTQ